jgi:hypothetical protein
VPAIGRFNKTSGGTDAEMKKLFIIPATALVLVSCSTTKFVEKPVYVKCHIPEVPKTPKPTIQPDMTLNEKLQLFINYMFDLEREVGLLRKAQEVCK